MKRRRILLSLLFCVAITLPLSAGPHSLGTQGALAKDLTPTGRLYVMQQGLSYRLMPMDADTLADLWSAPSILLGKAPSVPRIVTNRDGSLLAAIFTKQLGSSPPRARDITIHVINALTFNQVAHFHPAVSIEVRGMSADGSQLYGFRWSTNGHDPVRFYVLSARSGAVLRETQLPSACCSQPLLDLAAHRLYTLDGRASTTHTASLAVYDLDSGRVLHGQPLDGVLAGVWGAEQQSSNDPVVDVWSPGFALSPDGRSLAVLDGGTDTLRIVDANSGSVVRTERVTFPSSVLDRFGHWLGLVPSTAEAKEMEGVSLSMQFSPDGQSLYVTGSKGTFGTDGTFHWSGVGLRRIDVVTGTVMADTLDGSTLWLPARSLDGKTLYSLEAAKTAGGPFTLRRHDAATLQVTAERELDSPLQSLPEIVLLPAMTW